MLSPVQTGAAAWQGPQVERPGSRRLGHLSPREHHGVCSVTEQSAADHACSCDLQENKGVWAGSRPVSQVYSSGDWKEKERW